MASGSWLWDNAKWAALALLAALGVQFGGPVWAWISKTLGLKTLASMMVVPLKLSSGAASSQWQAAQKRSMNVKIMKACKEPVIRTTSELLWRLNQLDGMACLGKTQLEKTKPNAAAEIKALVDGPETRKKLQEQTIWQNSDKASGDGADTLEAKITGSEFWLQQAKEINEKIDDVDSDDLTALQVYVFVKQLLGRIYWLEEAMPSEKHKRYQIEHTCFLIGSFFYWIEALRSVSFNETMDADEARNFEKKRGDVAGKFRTNNLGSNFEVLGGEQRAIGEIMQKKQSEKNCNADRKGNVSIESQLLASRDGLMGYAEFRHNFSKNSEFKAWFAQIETDILALLEETKDDGSKAARLPKICDALVALLEFLVGKTEEDKKRFPYIESFHLTASAEKKTEAEAPAEPYAGGLARMVCNGTSSMRSMGGMSP